MCFDFLYNFIWNISRSKKNWTRYDQKCTLVFIQSTRNSCQILMKIEFFFGRFSKNTQISNSMKIRPVGAKLFHTDRQTDRHDEANNRFSQVRERASIYTKYPYIPSIRNKRVIFPSSWLTCI